MIDDEKLLADAWDDDPVRRLVAALASEEAPNGPERLFATKILDARILEVKRKLFPSNMKGMTTIISFNG